MPQILSKTGFARDILFVSSASRICELKNLALDFLNSPLKWSYVEKHARMSILAHFSVQKVNHVTLEENKISKIANKVLEKRPLKGRVPNFKTKALAVRKLKGKENCENEDRETATLMAF